MTRDVLKTAELGRKTLSNARHISISEMKQIYDILHDSTRTDNIWDVITTSVYFGVMLGYRQAKADSKR